jgi:hypothetical protein
VNTQIKRGTIREDGKLFWSYHNGGKEYWVTPEKFALNQERNGRWAKENAEKNKKNAKRWNMENRERYNENKKRSAKNNPDICKNIQLRNKFGITLDDYNKMLANQGGVCAICKQTCGTGKSLAVDHCHKTKKVRGLLCQHCNTGFGQFRESKKYLYSAIEYCDKFCC